MPEWTQEEVLEFTKTGIAPRAHRRVTEATNRIEPNALTHSRHRQASPRGTMNKLESKYAAELEILKRAGEIQWWAFESITLRLAKRTAYTPDFLIQHNDGSLEFIETKGHWEDDARCKIKVAAKMFPMFKFAALQPSKGGGWKREEFGESTHRV